MCVFLHFYHTQRLKFLILFLRFTECLFVSNAEHIIVILYLFFGAGKQMAGNYQFCVFYVIKRFIYCVY